MDLSSASLSGHWFNLWSHIKAISPRAAGQISLYSGDKVLYRGMADKQKMCVNIRKSTCSCDIMMVKADVQKYRREFSESTRGNLYFVKYGTFS